MSVKITYFVHGTTTDNEKDLGTGWLDGKLSELGVEQAINLGKQVAHLKFDEVFCSDLQRAIDSAAFGFSDKYRVKIDKRLRECDYGDLSGKPVSLFKERMTDFVDNRFPNGESYKDVEERIRSFVDWLRKEYDGKHIAIVAHQGPQLALDVVLEGKNWNQAINEDWRKVGKWQAGWEYVID